MSRKIPFTKGCMALWLYQDQVRSSLLRFKFHGKVHYADYYGQALAERLLADGVSFDILTWVPISRRRKLKRGYDQVELIARSLGRELDMPSTQCLRKIRHNQPQSSIKDAAQRRINVLGAYKAFSPSQFQGQRILLLDDIITTGATISECAKTLMAAGAKEVYCAAVAAAKHHK
jgi:ComF family protein